MHDPNRGKGPADGRVLSRRSWLAMVGVAGLASFGGCGLVGGFPSPDPRWIWTARLPGRSDVAAGAADDSTLYAYVHSDHGAAAVLALDSATGAERWSARLDSPLKGVVAMAPAGETLVIGANDIVAARDTATGRLRWQVSRSNWSGSAASTMRSAAMGVADGIVVVRSFDRIEALDLRTGDLIWGADLRSSDTTIASSADVAAHNGRCFSVNTHLVKASHGVSYRAWIDAWDLRTGRPVWSTEPGHGFGSDAWVLATGDRVIAGDGGSIVVVDAATGQQRWEAYAPSFLVVGDVLVKLAEGGGFAEVEGLDLADGTERWSWSESWSDLDSSEGEPDVHLVGGHGIVYVGPSGDAPVALDAASGAKQWTYHGQHPNSAATVIAARERDVYLAAGSRIEAITTT